MSNISFLYNAFNKIGTFNIMTFEGRLIFQKTSYFLQVFSAPLNYKFSWYIYGPYSPSLTDDGFRMLKEPQNVLDNFSDESLDKTINFLGNKKNDPIWLEVISSIHFLTRIYPEKSKEDIISIVMKKQPYITKPTCMTAWKRLEEFNLLGD